MCLLRVVPFTLLSLIPRRVLSTQHYLHIRFAKKVSSCVFRISKYKYTHANLSGARFPLMRRERVGALLQTERSLENFKGAWLRFKSEIQQRACVN
jgi:hypothetical protein